MDGLQDARKKIDAVDAELTRLFEERFETVRRVIEYKMEHGLPVLDSAREKEITERNCARLRDPRLTGYFERWYGEMLKQSRQYQEDLMDGNISGEEDAAQNS